MRQLTCNLYGTVSCMLNVLGTYEILSVHDVFLKYKKDISREVKLFTNFVHDKMNICNVWLNHRIHSMQY